MTYLGQGGLESLSWQHRAGILFYYWLPPRIHQFKVIQKTNKKSHLLELRISYKNVTGQHHDCHGRSSSRWSWRWPREYGSRAGSNWVMGGQSDKLTSKHFHRKIMLSDWNQEFLQFQYCWKTNNENLQVLLLKYHHCWGKNIVEASGAKKSNGRFRCSSNVWHFPWEYVSSNGGPTSFMTTSPRSTKSNILHSRSSRLFGGHKVFLHLSICTKTWKRWFYSNIFFSFEVEQIELHPRCTNARLFQCIDSQAITRSPASSRFCSISWAITWSRDRSVAGDSWERETRTTPEMTWAEWLSTVSTVLTSNCCSIF